MLPIAFILAFAAGLLVILGVLINQKCQERLSAVRPWADAQLDAMCKAAAKLDQDLARAIADGKSMADAVTDWQKERARVGPSGKADRPYAWTPEDADDHRGELIKRKTSEITRQTIVRMVICIVVTLAVTGAIILIYYQFLSQSSLSGSPTDDAATQLPADDFDSGGDPFDWDPASANPPANASGPVNPVLPPTTSPADSSSGSSANGGGVDAPTAGSDPLSPPSGQSASPKPQPPSSASDAPEPPSAPVAPAKKTAAPSAKPRDPAPRPSNGSRDHLANRANAG